MFCLWAVQQAVESSFEGTISQDFKPLVFAINLTQPSPCFISLNILNFAKIFKFEV
jgi:hypothetical protein